MLVICLTVFVGEFAIGNLWERLFGVQLWNYSSQPFHLTRYVSLFSATGYGVGAFVLFKYALKPFISTVKEHMDYDLAVKVSSTLGVLIVLDTFVMCLVIAVSGSAPVYWSLRL